MSYTYERFGAIALPTYNREASLAPVAARQRLVATVAGAFDGDGSGRSGQQFPHTLTLEAIVSEDTAAAQRSTLDAMRAAVGTRAYLYRRADDDSTVQRALCRLVGMTQDRAYEQRRAYQPFRLQFQQLGPWLGAIYSGPWTLDSGVYFDEGYVLDTASLAVTLTSGSQSISLSHNGDYPTSGVVATIVVQSGILTAISIYGAGWFLGYSGVLVTGQTMIIDAAAESITINGIAAYQNLSFGASHVIEQWMRLEPGENYVTVVTAGSANTTVQFEYTETWA